MKKLLVVFALLALTVFLAAPAMANSGCTPGFWKNNTNVWVTYTPSMTLGAVFPDVTNAAWARFGIDKTDTLLEALNYGGGPGLPGAARIFLRAAVAGLLNAAHPAMGFHGPVGGLTATQWVIDTVEANLNVTSCYVGPGLCATDSGLRESILKIAADWDAANNSLCLVDAHGNVITQ